MSRTRLFAAAAGLGILAGAAQAPAATLTYETNFTKTDNIYTNLNQQFPNTGPGVPGSAAGTPNASFLYNPYTFSPGTDLAGNNGISFNLASDAAGRDFTEFGSAGFGLPGSVTVPIGASGLSSVAALVSAYNGTTINAIFTGIDGTTQTFSNISVPDFNGGGTVNSCAGGVGTLTAPCEQTAFQVTDVGGGGSGNSSNGAFNTYDLVELNFSLDSALASEALASVTFSDGGYEGLLLGVTAVSAGSSGGGGGMGVPEPASFAPLAAGLLGLGLLRRKTA